MDLMDPDLGSCNFVDPDPRSSNVVDLMDPDPGSCNL